MNNDDRLRLLLRGGPRHRFRRIGLDEGRLRLVIRYRPMSRVARLAWHRSKS